MIRWSLIIFFLSLSSAIAANKSPSNPKWTLWNGATVLRGVNIWQKILTPDDAEELGKGKLGPPYSASSFARLKALGANYVNISHPGIFSEKPPYRLVPESLRNLDNLVKSIRASGCYVVIGFRTGPGRDENGFDPSRKSHSLNTVWKDSAAQEAWSKMWRFTAKHFKKNAAVIGYALMVEPNSDDLFFPGESPEIFQKKHQGSTYDWNVFSNKLLAAVRLEDKKTPVLIGSMGYSSIEWLPNIRLTQDPYVVYDVHQYAPYEYTNQLAGALITYPSEKTEQSPGFNKIWLQKQIFEITNFKNKTGKPVTVNEFGVTRWAPNGVSFLQDEIDLFEEAGLNYAYWLWESDWPKIKYDEFNFRYGTSATSHSDVPNNPLTNLLKSYWARNHKRP